ncbi:MAG TPA: glycosyltransferase family 39 protein [candidate division Zixibacteria bacterium]|nr:glycosyltransferase family 39 protein [candidate division Zixibacteria bacterium]MDD4917656.1 glycosyltransferase family 39 protein [candidate division Zixibacteria bacterium]MDM7974060.1 glycosyltransferase family 39 protein [candidate division Zixibacteria bacterium]HOD65526.1 glycosyltransferase family 39 protein [candidate division Zixibacteria bacterium]HPM36964.1 glycosyltransferase family 39 protein [candidate division Zixibacteria bacterium]
MCPGNLAPNRFFSSSHFVRDGSAILLTIALVKLCLHLVVNITGGYGMFRDEFYYIACSDHMAWGYVDQPPLSIAILWLNRLLLGDSLFALRLLPAVTGAVVVLLAGLMTRELGGGKYSQILASICALLAPLTLAINAHFSMNSFDTLLWTLAFYLLILIAKHDLSRHWILLGIVLGLGLMNKISVLWLGTGLLIALLATPYRALLLTRRVWFAVALSVILFLPHIIWQIANNFPTLEFMSNALADKYVSVSPWDMFSQQVLNMSPVSFPIWFAGLTYFLVSRSTRQFRVLPIIFLAVFLILIVSKNSKSEYLGPMSPMLFALGSFTVEKFVLWLKWRWLRPVILASVILGGLVPLPLTLALLPVDTFIAYSRALGIGPSTPEKKELSELPQYYADMFGWKEMTAAVAEAYARLTPEEQSKCVILCNNYGEAGAIDYFGGEYHLPRAISGHNNYWLWGCQNSDGEVVIRLGGSEDAMKECYGEVIPAGIFTHRYCMPYENNQTIWICKNRRASLITDWPDFKNFE